MAILPNLIYTFKAILDKIPAGSWQKLQAYPKIYMEVQESQNSQNNFEMEVQNWRSPIPDFKTYYRTTVVKTV